MNDDDRDDFADIPVAELDGRARARRRPRARAVLPSRKGARRSCWQRASRSAVPVFLLAEPRHAADAHRPAVAVVGDALRATSATRSFSFRSTLTASPTGLTIASHGHISLDPLALVSVADVAGPRRHHDVGERNDRLGERRGQLRAAVGRAAFRFRRLRRGHARSA